MLYFHVCIYLLFCTYDSFNYLLQWWFSGHELLCLCLSRKLFNLFFNYEGYLCGYSNLGWQFYFYSFRAWNISFWAVGITRFGRSGLRALTHLTTNTCHQEIGTGGRVPPQPQVGALFLPQVSGYGSQSSPGRAAALNTMPIPVGTPHWLNLPMGLGQALSLCTSTSDGRLPHRHRLSLDTISHDCSVFSRPQGVLVWINRPSLKMVIF
jgi:hypothetical protein